MLNVRCISSRETWPYSASRAKRFGTGQLAPSIAASSVSGSTRFTLPGKPPPVMWAMPWIFPSIGLSSGRYDRWMRSSTSATVAFSPGNSSSTRNRIRSATIRRASE
jgi:hypothetical protein